MTPRLTMKALDALMLTAASRYAQGVPEAKSFLEKAPWSSLSELDTAAKEAGDPCIEGGVKTLKNLYGGCADRLDESTLMQELTKQVRLISMPPAANPHVAG